MDAADFYCGQFDLDQQTITLMGTGTNKWRGINLVNSNATIYNSKFLDIEVNC